MGKLWVFAALLALAVGIGLYGLRDSGEDISPTTTQEAESKAYQAEDLVLIRVNRKYGYTNTQGELVIPPQFDTAQDFAANGLAAAAMGRYPNTKWGYINTQGEWVITPRFANVSNFAVNGLAAVKEYSEYSDFDFDNLPAEILAAIEVNDWRWFDGVWGYINTKGEIVIPPRFEDVLEFGDNGLAAAMENEKWGYINAQGEWVIPPRFEEALNFETHDLALVAENRKWGFINTKGEWAIPPKFDDAYSFAANDLHEISFRPPPYTINLQGEPVFTPRFEAVWGFAANGLAVAEENEKRGYINLQGEWVIPPRFEMAWPFSANGLAAVKENRKWGYINAQGEWVISPQFENAYAFATNGLAKVDDDFGKWGDYINMTGQTVISIEQVCGERDQGCSRDQECCCCNSCAEVLKNANGEVLWPQETAAQASEERQAETAP